jgi:hypothetical protein
VDLGIDDHAGSRLSFGMHAAQQRRPGRGQRRPHLQHGTPIEKPVSAG